MIDKLPYKHLYPSPNQHEFNFFFRVMNELSDIYYGRVKHDWGVPIEDWSIKSIEEQQKIPEYEKTVDAKMS